MKKLFLYLFLGLLFSGNALSETIITTYNCARLIISVEENGKIESRISENDTATLIKKYKFSQDEWGSIYYGTANFIYDNYDSEYIINKSINNNMEAYSYSKIDNDLINNEKNDDTRKLWKKNKGKLDSMTFLTLENQRGPNNHFFYLQQTFASSLWTLETDINQNSGWSRHFVCKN